MDVARYFLNFWYFNMSSSTTLKYVEGRRRMYVL
nr:MAG TPA: hypothetical protein [Bacteriophage sp.]